MLGHGTDGLDHINIYSAGATRLGQWMSNFELQPIELKEFGRFQSIEGLWHWLGCRVDKLRYLWGSTAKLFGGRQEKKHKLKPARFRAIIRVAIRLKIRGNPAMQDALECSTLPFAHYYVAPARGRKFDAGKQYDWLVEAWEAERHRLKKVRYGLR